MSYTMEETEFLQLVQEMAEKYQFSPEAFTDYQSPFVHSQVARFLMNEQRYEEARRLYEMVIGYFQQSKLAHYDYPWALRNMSYIAWKVDQNFEDAVKLAVAAIEVYEVLAPHKRDPLHFGGVYLRYILDLHLDAGAEAQAIQIARDSIDLYKKRYEGVKRNSFLFEAYLFLAHCEQMKHGIVAMLPLLHDALSYTDFGLEAEEVLHDGELSLVDKVEKLNGLKDQCGLLLVSWDV